jgi:hypothetical protein
VPEVHDVALLEVAVEEHFLEEALRLALRRRRATEDVGEGSLCGGWTHESGKGKRHTQHEADCEPHVWSSWARGLLAVQGQVQGEHVHSRLAEKAERAPFNVPLDELPDRFRVELADPRDARDLVEGRGGADVRVEAAA